MITRAEANAYIKEFVPTGAGKEVLDEIEKKIKDGDRHPWAFTTHLCREYAEDLAKYCRSLGYTNARIMDIYSKYGVKGGNYLKIDL